jgi:hypothetical protein
MKNNQRLVIFNRAPVSAVDGWIHIVPKGELPNAEAGIVQVLDDTALDSILANIAKVKNRLGDNWPGIYAGREHFIYDSTQDSEALAWFKNFEKRPNGIWTKDDGLTDIGTEAVTNRRYKFTSFAADPSDLKKISGNRYRVMAIETVGFTNQANGKELLTPITNRSLRTATGGEITFADASAEADANKTTNKGQQMKSVCTLLGLSAEADEQSVHAAVTKLLNRADITPAALTSLQAEHKTFGEQNQTLLGEQVDGLIAEHGLKDEKVINRLKPVLATLKNRKERLDYLADFGFKPVEAGKSAPAPRILNRGTTAVATTETDEAVTLAAEQDRAQKVMNRASAIVKETPSIGLATATMMASKEIK